MESVFKEQRPSARLLLAVDAVDEAPPPSPLVVDAEWLAEGSEEETLESLRLPAPVMQLLLRGLPASDPEWAGVPFGDQSAFRCFKRVLWVGLERPDGDLPVEAVEGGDTLGFGSGRRVGNKRRVRKVVLQAPTIPLLLPNREVGLPPPLVVPDPLGDLRDEAWGCDRATPEEDAGEEAAAACEEDDLTPPKGCCCFKLTPAPLLECVAECLELFDARVCS